MDCASPLTAAICASGPVTTRAIGVFRIVRRKRLRLCCTLSRGSHPGCLCAPGGKATHLAELVEDQAEIWAVDRSPGRLKRVASNAARLGLSSIHALAADASNLLEQRPHWRESFQRILIDAPCSGLGTLARHPDARWRVSPESIRGLLPQQQALLDGLVPLLAPSGTLVYATCTIHPDENQAQVQDLLKRQPSLQLMEESQRWPDQASGGDGFYSAVLQRV